MLKIMNLSHAATHGTRAANTKGFAMTTPNVSFEFFPPKTLEASFKLWETAKVLAPLAPDFVSVTYAPAARPAS